MSHRNQTHVPEHRPTRKNATVPQISKPSFPEPETRKRSSVASSISACSADSNDNSSVKPPARRRLSGLPRPTNTQSGPRLDAIASSRPTPTLNNPRTPKTNPTAKSHPPVQDQDIFLFYPAYDTPIATMAPGPFDPPRPTGRRTDMASLDPYPDSLLGQAFPDKPKPLRPFVVPPFSQTQQRAQEFPPRLIPELQALAAASPPFTSAPSASISSISSPSTDSPGVWSNTSRNTTPTSMSSYSPGVPGPPKMAIAGKRANTVPITAVSKTKPPRLPVLQEALHSSGSSLTEFATSTPKRTKKTPLNSPAPTPPPRVSSVHHRASKSGGDIPSVAQVIAPNRAAMVANLENSPLTQKAVRQIEKVGESLQYQTPLHQGARPYLAPPRPSREGVRSLDPRKPVNITGTLPSSRRDKARSAKALSDNNPAEPLPKSRRTIIGNTTAANATSRSQDKRPLPPTTTSRPESPPTRTRARLPQIVSGTRSKQTQNVAETLSSTRLGKFSRFAIFGRRIKRAEDVEGSPRKLQRKGPTAGTGHEGYGKFSLRGRKTSLDSEQSGSGSERSETSLERFQNRFRSRKQSISSKRDRSSQSDLDDFAAKRLQPVVMRGGSSRGDSDSYTPSPNAEREQPGSSSNNQFVAPYSNEDHVLQGHTDVAATYPQTTELRKSDSVPVRTQAPGSNFSRIRTPTQVETPERPAMGYSNSTNTSQSSVSAAVISNPIVVDPGMYTVDAGLLKSQDKTSKRSKWNFFSRSTQTAKTTKALQSVLEAAPRMPVRISAGPSSRSVPYYAVMESESDNNTTETLGQTSAEAESPPPLPMKEGPTVAGIQQQERRVNSVLLPSLPVFRGDPQQVQQQSSPRVPLQPKQVYQPPQEPLSTPEPRPRRLAAVGRIPRVVSRRGRPKAPDPTPVPHPEQAYPSGQVPLRDYPVTSSYEQPTRGLRADILPNRQLYYTEAERPLNTYTLEPRFQIEPAKKEFLRFPSKHSSDVSASSSSTGAFSLTAPASILPPQTYAVSRHHGGEDEVWNEFDDFIDDVMSPSESMQVRPSTRAQALSSRNFSYSRPTLPNKIPALARQATLPEAQHSLSSRTPPVVFPPPLLLPEANSGGEVRLRRSRIVSALHSSPSSPFSIGDYLAEYGDWNRNSNKILDRLSRSTATRSGNPSLVPIDQSLEVTEPGEQSQQHNAILLDVVGRSKNPAAQSELHFASLMISRWLSFGRVLFSPAHDEIHNIPERHVLVLDGLGSVDWSVYCAVVYQEQRAFVHDLKEKDAGQSPIDPGHTPSNYRRAEVQSLSDRFPFPPSFFSAIVIRFPPTMSDHKLRNILAECRRVLSPGGYLELMLLDLDIVNMGPQTKRAIKELKIRITTSDRSINLKPMSDNVQSHLGQQGFLNLSRCVVGVPVAGKVSGSVGSSSSSRSSRESYGQQRRSLREGQKTVGQQGRPSTHHRPGQNFSLNDLVSDHSENADEKIGKMVARTARSWWQHSFEAAVIPDGDVSRSIFADKRIIRECKMRNSTFKLLIAYTQRPILENKRRTMSEPVVPTLVTAGAGRSKRTIS